IFLERFHVFIRRVLLLGLVGLVLGLLNLLLDVKRLLLNPLGFLDRVTDVDVVKENVLVHGPKLKAYSTNGLEIGRSLVLIVVWVGDLAGSPDTLVGGVVNERGGPLALVVGVGNLGPLPWSAAGSLSALGVGDLGGKPITVLLVVPIFRLLGLRVRDGFRLILEPVIGLGCLLVLNLIGRIFIPIIGLLRIRVRNHSIIDPVGRLLVV